MNNHILLIEADAAESNVEFMLLSLEHNVERVTSNEAALDALNKSAFDLLIISVHLIEGAAELVEAVKKNHNLPIMAISPINEQMEFDIARCISAGVDDILPAELMETLIATQTRSLLEKETLRKGQAKYLQEIKEQKGLVEQQNEDLKAMNELKNRFIGMAAHDLRNPLASIKGFSDLLLMDDSISHDQRLEYIQIINESSAQMLALVNELLDVAVIESGRLQLDSKPASLKEVIASRALVFELIASKKGSKLEAYYSGDDCCVIDRGRMIQVLDNLISNAIKFSPSGTTITIAQTTTDKHVVVSVADEGPGLSEDDLKSMFQDFKKLSARPTGDEASTGLGLAIVKRIVEAHNGEIKVESKLGEGAKFIVQLPLPTQDLQPQ